MEERNYFTSPHNHLNVTRLFIKKNKGELTYEGKGVGLVYGEHEMEIPLPLRKLVINVIKRGGEKEEEREE